MGAEGNLVFGTGGIRCLMGIGPSKMNTTTVGQVTQGLANWLVDESAMSKKAKPLCVAVVYDTRIHSESFARTTACVLVANGFRVLMFSSPQPTPLLSYTIRARACVAGVCITASHNSREWNGYKVYDSCGVQATDGMARALQKAIAGVNASKMVLATPFEQAVRDGSITFVESSLIDSYHADLMLQRLGVDSHGLRVVYSPLNGTGRDHAAALLSELGVDYSMVPSQSEPDGTFPSCPRPNPEDPDALQEGMRLLEQVKADLFLATDPDADRLGVVCAHYGKATLLSGDEVGLLLLDYIARLGLIPTSGSKAAVAVTTIVTSPLADVIAKAYGIELRRTLTGFKYIGEQIGLIQAEGKEFVLGIEESDGYLRGSFVRDKDGLNAMVLVCEVASYYKKHGKDLAQALDDLYRRYGYVVGEHMSFCYEKCFMTEIRRLPPKRIGTKDVVDILDYLYATPASDVLEWRLDGGSRIVMRPSGTEPKIKAYVFAAAATRGEAARLLNELCDYVRMHVFT